LGELKLLHDLPHQIALELRLLDLNLLLPLGLDELLKLIGRYVNPLILVLLQHHNHCFMVRKINKIVIVSALISCDGLVWRIPPFSVDSIFVLVPLGLQELSVVMSSPVLAGIQVDACEACPYIHRMVAVRRHHLHFLAFPAIKFRAYFYVFSAKTPLKNEFDFVEKLFRRAKNWKWLLALRLLLLHALRRIDLHHLFLTLHSLTILLLLKNLLIHEHLLVHLLLMHLVTDLLDVLSLLLLGHALQLVKNALEPKLLLHRRLRKLWQVRLPLALHRSQLLVNSIGYVRS